MDDAGPRDEDDPTSSTPRRALRSALFLLGLALVIVVAGSLADLLRIRDDLSRGHDRLDHLTIDAIRRDSISGLLDATSDDLASADDRAHESPFLRAVSWIPAVGSQVDAVRDLTSAADELGAEAADSGHRIDAALAEAGRGAEGRVRVFDVVLAELDRLERAATDVDIGAEGFLVRPVANARLRLATAIDGLPERLEPVHRQVRTIRDMLRGPSTYMLLIGNNAEMRSMAMPLTAAKLTVADGEMSLSDITPAGKRILITSGAGGLNAGPALDRLREPYPEWLIGTNILATSVVPSFPVTAPLYAGIAESAENWQTDGVVFLDVLAVAPLLDIVGPVTVDGVEYTADNAAQLILNEPYLAYDTPEESDERREASSAVAQAVFESIKNHPVDVLDLVASLQRSAVGRHFMAWSPDPLLEQMFASLGISGWVSPNDTLITFQNTAANKLDYYVTGEIEIDDRPLANGEREISVAATVSNPAVEQTHSLLGRQLPDGTHRMMFSMHLPANATDLRIDDAEITEYGFDGTSQVIGARFLVPRGGSTTVRASYRLPGEVRRIRILPSGRINPVTWIHDGRAFTDDRPFAISLGSFPTSVSEQRQRSFATMAGVVAVAGAIVLLSGHRRWERAGRPAAGVRNARIDRITGAGLTAVALVLALLALFVV